MAIAMWVALLFCEPAPPPRRGLFSDATLQEQARAELACAAVELTVQGRNEERQPTAVCARGCATQARYVWSTATSSWERSPELCDAPDR
jgi:hypothetical protein